MNKKIFRILLITFSVFCTFFLLMFILLGGLVCEIRHKRHKTSYLIQQSCRTEEEVFHEKQLFAIFFSRIKQTLHQSYW